MNKIMQRYEDQHVVKTYVYVKTNKAYSDEAQTKAINAVDLERLYLHGLVIVDTGISYMPVSGKMVSTNFVVTYIKTDGTTATVGVLATAASTEPVA